MICLSKNIISEIPKNAKICIYGSGQIGFEIKDKLALVRPDIKFCFFIDSYVQGKVREFDIVKIDNLSAKNDEFDYIIIASFSNKYKIKEILKEYKIDNYIYPEQILYDELSNNFAYFNTSEEIFKKKILNTIPYRRCCNCLFGQSIVLICTLSALNDAKKFIQQFSNLEIKKIYIAGCTKNHPEKLEFNFTDKTIIVPIFPLSCINTFEHNNFFVFYENNLNTVPAFSKELNNVGLSTFSYYWPGGNCNIDQYENNDYLRANIKQLHYAYSLLEDEYSKECFIRRIKAILSGTSGYLGFSQNDEYYIEHVKPEPGDVFIDAGVSADLTITEQIAITIGKEGKIYSFEPEPYCFKEAKEKINKSPNCKNVEIFEFGLWDKKDQLQISADTSASRICDNDSIINESITKSNLCDLITLDEFVVENKVNKIDYIKLDIEGAELNALKGAINTIRTFKPKLAVCVYHVHSHLFELISFINSLNLGYEFFFDHHSIYFYGTVLYARIKTANC